MMVRKIVIQPNNDEQAQRAFKESFEERSGVELYENILVREENGNQIVYSKLDPLTHCSLVTTMAKFSINVISDTDFTEGILGLYCNNRLIEFVDSTESLSPEEFLLHIYDNHITQDAVLDKISIAGMGSLNAIDRKVLSTPEAKKSAIC